MNTQVTVPAPAVEVVQGDDFWIVVKDLVSAQQRPIGETDFEPLFSGVSFSVKAGEVFSISASDKAEAHALCRVLGTLCPYYSGQCRIGKYGTPQKKRRMLPHLFNIDMPQMLVDHVTVLQQLMLVTMADTSTDDITRQERMLDLLEEYGLSQLTLVDVSALTDQEKLLIELMIASFSGARIIVFNVLDYEFTQEQIYTIRAILQKMRARNKTVVLATLQPRLIGIACDTTTFLYKGKQLYCGSVEQLCADSDKVGFVLYSAEAEVIADRIRQLNPQWDCVVDGRAVYLFNYSGTPTDIGAFYEFLSCHSIFPDEVKINRGRVENAFTELVHQHDLHKTPPAITAQ